MSQKKRRWTHRSCSKSNRNIHHMYMILTWSEERTGASTIFWLGLCMILIQNGAFNSCVNKIDFDLFLFSTIKERVTLLVKCLLLLNSIYSINNIFYWERIRQTFKRFSSTIVSLKLRAHQEERAEYYY